MNAVYEILVAGGGGGSAQCRFVLPDEAQAELNRILQEHALSVSEFLSPTEREVSRTGHHPWAIVCFPVELPVPGHVAALRLLKWRVPMASYSRRLPHGLADEESVPPVGACFVDEKNILQELAAKSPLFEPAWLALGQCAEDRMWLCVSDAPPAAWVETIAVGDAKRYRDARDSEREWLELSGVYPKAQMPKGKQMLTMDSVEYMELGAEVNRLRFSGRSQEAIDFLLPRLRELDHKARVWSLMLLVYAAEEGGLSEQSVKFAVTLESIAPGAPCARKVLTRDSS